MGRRFEQQMPAHTGETLSVSVQGVIWPSPDSRTRDFIQDPRARDALMASPAGLLSKGRRTGEDCPGCLCACYGLPASCIYSADGSQPLSRPLPASHLSRGADGVSESGPALPMAERSAQPAAAACLQSCPRRQPSAGGVINNAPRIYLTLQL